MAFEVETKTLKWLLSLKVVAPTDIKQLSTSTFEIKDPLGSQFQNGIKVSLIVMEIYKKKGLPLPSTLNHLKLSNNTAAMLYNWNILNDALKKMDFQIDSETKNLIINGDRTYLAMSLRKLHKLYETDDYEEDSLEADQLNNYDFQKENQMKQSLTLSKSEQPHKTTNFKASGLVNSLQKMRIPQNKGSMAQGDLLEFIINELANYLKLSRKQAVALLSDNNKYLAHVLVKGVKGQYTEIEELLQKFYSQTDYIVEKMMEQNDMCFYFLQIIKPCLLSKNEEIAQWGCRILTKVANQLANKQMLPLAYDWFVQEAGGLSTTILALSRHPKLNQHVVGYILQFARYNVTQLFTIQLKKITNNDQLSYVKFMLLIFNPLVQSKISAEQLLNSGAIDYWVQITMKGAESEFKNSKQLRMYCIQFLIKIWRAYPSHIEDTLDQVNNIMTHMKRGIRDDSQVMRFSLMEMMFDLLDEFAAKKNPYASIVYKKLTFLFIQNHEQLTMRQFMLRNIQNIFQKYPTIPVDIFLQPFIKQIKISQSKSYVVNIFDMQFINVAVRHRKLKVSIGLQLFDLLAKTKLNSFSFSIFATQAMDILIQRFMQEQLFLEYTVKLVKISLAMFYSTLKQKKPYQDQQRLQAQKRAEIVNFIISLLSKANEQLNTQIKTLVIHVKVQILNRLGTQHRGIQRILGFFNNIDDQINEAIENMRDQVSSNATSTAKSKSNFHLPKIQSRNQMLRDQTSSQQSFQSNGTRYSQASKQQFPIKDYTEFASDDEKKFYKENGLGLKKKNMTKKKGYSAEKEHVDPKIQEQIYKVKLRKEEEEKKKQKEKEYLQRKKQLLKVKIQKELEQRNIKQGVKGHEKDVAVKVIFEENELNQKILDEDEENYFKDIVMMKEEERDSQSIKLMLKRYSSFVKKIFSRYCNLKGKKDLETEELNQLDLIRICKEKNIQKNKSAVIQLMRNVNNKNVNNINIDGFFKFLQALCVSVYLKEKCKTNLIMGDLMKKILRRMSQGQNFKLDEDDDEACQAWSQKVRYNPHLELPQNLKKVYERVYKINDNCSYPTQKAVKDKYVVCYEVVNQILKNALKINVIEEQVRFLQEARVIHKKQYYLPPKPLKKEKEEPISLLEEREGPSQIKQKKNNRVYSKKNQSVEKENVNSKSRSKIVNPAQARRIQEEEEKQKKKQQEEQYRKQRALEVKKKLQLQQQEREKEKQKKKSEKKAQQDKQEERVRKQKQRKQKYIRDQKQKVQKHKREQEQKEKEEKHKNQVTKQKEDEQRKQKNKEQMKKDEEKRKQEYEKMKKDRQLSQEKNKKKKEEDEKKKQLLKKQMMKKIEDEKQKHEINKMSKEMLKKLFSSPQIQELVNSKYKEELKAIFNYGKQFNQFKLDKGNTNTLEQKGWLTLCQQLSFCDTAIANKIIKMHLKETNSSGFNLQDFQRTLFEMSVRKDVENELEDFDKAKKISRQKFDKYISGLKLPKENQKLKSYFVNLKNQINKKKEEMVVTNPDGKKETWQVNE